MRAARRFAGIALRALVLWALVALVFWIAVALIPGIQLPSFEAALLATALIAVLNASLWPLLIRVVLPLTVLSFGLFSLDPECGAGDCRHRPGRRKPARLLRSSRRLVRSLGRLDGFDA